MLAVVERGNLTLATRASEVLPGFAGEGREAITLRHLLTHTSGLSYESPEMEARLIARMPLDAILDEAAAGPLLFPPGNGFSYSDYGYGLAGQMAAAVTGETFPDLVRTLVLEPAGLADTFMPPPGSEYPRLAWVDGPLAHGTDGAMYNSPYALDLAHPAFGTVATVSDLLRFGLLFAPKGSHRLHSEATIRVMTTDATGGYVHGGFLGVDSPAPIPWGLGFMVKGEVGPGGDLVSSATFSHGGASGCTLQVDPVNDIVVAFVSNRHANTGRGRSGLRSTAAGAGPLPRWIRRPAGAAQLHSPAADLVPERAPAQAAIASGRSGKVSLAEAPETSRPPSRRSSDDASSALAATVRIALLSAFRTLSHEAR